MPFSTLKDRSLLDNDKDIIWNLAFLAMFSALAGACIAMTFYVLPVLALAVVMAWCAHGTYQDLMFEIKAQREDARSEGSAANR